MTFPIASPLWLRDLAGAWIFYTVFPAWPGVKPGFDRIARFAPWIGAVLGGLQALLWWLLEGRVPSTAQVALVLSLGLLLTGGLHSDGAMDTADGLAAGERRCLEAMADSRVGAAGVQALALLLLVRAGALLSLAATPGVVLTTLLWAAVLGRVAPLIAMARFPYLRSDGSAGFHRRHWAGLARELIPTAIPVSTMILLSAWFGWPLVGLTGLLPTLLVPLWLGRRLGGHTGDSYGACVEWSETLTLLISAALVVSRVGAWLPAG